MSKQGRVTINKLPTGVQKLDDVLGGGIPEYSFNLIAGDPGSGKTTLAHQIMFANATEERPALFFTLLGEPSIKMLRYQQQFRFFDVERVNKSVHFINLSQETMERDLAKVLESITSKIEKLNPGIVVVDAFHALVRLMHETPPVGMTLQEFVQRLAMIVTSWQATTFLIGEESENELRENPAYPLADGVIALFQSVNRNSMVRKLQIIKMRGQASQPGLHTVRITDDGLQIFPRLLKPIEESQHVVSHELISTGIKGLDEMLGGGTFRGSSMLVAGPSGSGKTTTAIQFIAEGVRQDEPGVMAIFEETTPKYLAQARSFGFDLKKMIKAGKLEMVYIRPLDLSVDETLYAIQTAIDKVGAKRVAIDSISGLETAVAPTFKEDFCESLYRLLGALTGVGITIMMTVELTENYNELRFTPHTVSFLTHDIILQRYVELEGQLRTIITIIKTRGRRHSHDLRAYEVTEKGIVIGEVLKQYRGILTAVPHLRESARPWAQGGLTDCEAIVLLTLKETKQATVKELDKLTGLPARELTQALNRLTALNYADKATENKQTIYRAK